VKDFDEGVMKIVAELGANERHFNTLQHQYRLLASTWLLAVFGGVGFAITHDQLPLQRFLLVALIGLAGAVGITQLWNLDLRVYHQLLDACFVQGLELERENPWLPQLRASMLETQAPAPGPLAASGRKPPAGVLARVVWFYVAANITALSIAVIGMALYVDSLHPVVVIGAGVILAAAWSRELYRQTRSPALEEWMTRRASS
jgi:hypothetical protein